MQTFEELKKQYTDETFKNRYESFHNKAYPDIHDVNGLPFHFDAKFNRIGLSILGEMWIHIEDEQPPACKVCFFCKERQWVIDNSKKYLIKQ
jgi:hypothetical protein